MEPEQRGRASRASSTSSLGREVRCGCQYYQSDSLLPERRALLGRPPSRTMQQPPAVRCSEHEYEPIAPPPSAQPATAPVVRITETDVLPVADSDDSIDDRGRITPGLMLDGDVVLPLDGRIEDSAMEGRELVATGDTSEELESPQQLQERLEERFLTAATPCTESRTDGEINTSQVDSSALEELPLRRGARGLPQRIKNQAGKLRSRLRGFQRPTFSFPERQKPDKARSASSGRSDKSKSPRGERRPSRMDRLRSSFSERPKFSLPARPKFNLPDRSKFHLPERPKFSLPERPKFHLDKSKFNIKKPNIRLPSALSRSRKPSSTREPHSQRSTESTVGSKRNIFDFSTYPRIFDRKSKNRGDYATSSPKNSRAQSAESATFPRARKGISARWAQRWAEAGHIDDDRPDAETIVERSHPWRHPSMEEPRLSVRMEEEILAAAAAIPWEEPRKRGVAAEEELQYMDYEQESPETSDRQAQPTSQEASRTEEESYDHEPARLDPRLYGDQGVRYAHPRKEQGVEEREDWRTEEETMMAEQGLRPIQRSKSLDERVAQDPEDDRYEGSFPPVDPRRFGPPKLPSEEEGYEEDMDEADEEREQSSAHSDREQQQSSGSSCDRRRRGVIEEIDSDEFFLRASGLSQDDMTLGKYLASEIRDALRSETGNALADEEMPSVPPKRPTRSRSLRKRKEDSVESYEAAPPARPKRERPAMRRSASSTDAAEAFRERTRSGSRHRVVYQAETSSRERSPLEPLDDIVVVKPARRKSRTSSRSQSQAPVDSTLPSSIVPRRSPSPSSTPPIVPTRRKRSHREIAMEQRNNVTAMCNGHGDWLDRAPEKPLPSPPSKESLEDGRELAKDILTASEEDVRELVMRLRNEDYVEPVPVPPKRRSRSRGTSVAQDDDRTSHGAESLPEAGYAEEDIPRDESLQDLPGYAVIEKRDKPPRPPPPRRRRDKFATTPRPSAPKRPVRAYSTLGPTKSRDTSILSESVSMILEPADSTRYIEIDSDDPEHKDLRSGQVVSKMQGRPLPAPPRPPRARKEPGGRLIEEFAMETTTATQTDPLPEDMIIEEEITQAKLVVAPSHTGSQVLVSMERIPSPACITTPPVPPLPVSQFIRRDEQPSYDTVSLKSPSPVRELEDMEERHLSAPHLQEPLHSDDETRGRSGIAALLAEDTLKIGSLEVGDLRVDRLSVSQIEAHKIVASEVDAMVIAASELRSIAGGGPEESLSPAIIKELIAIRSHLETVAASQMQERAELEARMLAQVHEKTVIPAKEERGVQAEERPSESASSRDMAQVEEKSEPGKDEKIQIPPFL
ncbi:hypothetical protein KM043_017459 [Ampulex compressa]|nr:hypothetical protein KM043_017459 [Ampulex compressa]